MVGNTRYTTGHQAHLFAVSLVEVVHEELSALSFDQVHTVRPSGKELLAHPGGQTYTNSYHWVETLEILLFFFFPNVLDFVTDEHEEHQ